MGKKKHSLIDNVIRFVNIVPLCLRLANNFIHLIESEAGLVKQIITLVIAIIFSFYCLLQHGYV